MKRMSSDPARKPRSLQPANRSWLVDLAVIGLLTVITAVLLWTTREPEVLLWALGVPFLVFYPGYAVIAAVYPEQPSRIDKSSVAPRNVPSRIARIGLAVLISPILLSAIGILLSPFGLIQLEPLLVAITMVTVFTLLLAGIRRVQLPAHLRDGFGVSDFREAVAISIPESSTQNLVLGISVLILLGVIGLAIVAPLSGEAYTETYLLTETNGENGEFIADDYPVTETAGQTQHIYVGIQNHENTEMNYEGVTVIQERTVDGEIIDQIEVDQFQITLENEEEGIEEQSFAWPESNESLRLQVLIYKGSAPDDRTVESADHILQLQRHDDNG